MAAKILTEDETLKTIRASVGMDISESDIRKAISIAENNVEEAIRVILETPGFVNLGTVKRTSTGGARISTQVKEEVFDVSCQSSDLDSLESGIDVKDEKFDVGSDDRVNVENLGLGLDQDLVVDLKGGCDLGVEKKGILEKEIGDFDGNEVKEGTLDDLKVEADLGVVNKEILEEKIGDLDGNEVKEGSLDDLKVEADLGIVEEGLVEDDSNKEGDFEGLNDKSDSGIEKREVVKEEPQLVDRMNVDSDLGLEKREIVEEEPQSVDGMNVESDLGFEKAAAMEKPASSSKCEQSGRQSDDLKENSELGLENKDLMKKEPVMLDDCEPPKSKMETINESKSGSNVGDQKITITLAEPLNSYQSPAVKRKNDSISSSEAMKVESDLGLKKKGFVKEEPVDLEEYQPKRVKKEPEVVVCDDLTGLKSNYFSSYNRTCKQETKAERAPGPSDVEDGEFPDDPAWVLVGRSTVTGLSTCRGKKLDFNEIVHFAFPATSKIVRFSTKRAGEIGRLPIEWTNCIIPLVKASKVKVCGRCVAAPLKLSLMQEIHLYVSFYIHHSIFTEGDKSSWSLSTPSYVDSSLYPLPTLFKLLKIIPFQKAEFTPEELDSRKRPLKGSSDGDLPLRSLAKRRKVYTEQKTDEQVVSESTLNKLVGAADVYNLKEMDPPDTLTCVLHAYQKQALFWMSESEKGIDVEQAAKTLHPCWEAYRLTDKKASAVYVNIFSGEATTRFPSATKIAKGGILADAMGLGKTVMTIALILARPGRNVCEKEVSKDCKDEPVEEGKQNKKQSQARSLQTVKGGTLIVCPMALLGQWKDELDTHSTPGSLQVYVQYGVDRSANPATLAANDVVLTTYGVLAAAYKSDSDASIFHKVEWFRVVLDEAHTIKSSKTQVAQAAFALAAHCRWCLTGTPIQNNLEDLYSLLCFLHVEPWCNWAWWQKLIQKPYELGDPRAMKLIKSILRQLMLRRTKDTKDKEGRPILVLPPTDIQVIECKQSVAERDFYDALFKRSKVQFDQFVAQGKVLHNYANILELLLRLRQCCNHPYLVMSRADCTKYTDLDKLARQFLETTSKAAATPAYIDEVVEGIRKGENSECPICLESADDPVLTPCAHRICRECLFSSWRSSTGGLCPICRQHVMKTELITCPSENKFRVDYENNWKESAKVSKLLDCLEKLHAKGCGEKSIVFSQWTSFFDLLQIPLNKRGIKFLRFDGKLSQRNREIVLKEFNEGKDKMVLLMSLKAGGVGLNLTAASNVFLMDPWWNPAVEEQAIMRIHRIGQKRTVCVRRFIVKDTVEERMQQVQARKERMIAGALTDGEVRTARIEELKMLFR